MVVYKRSAVHLLVLALTVHVGAQRLPTPRAGVKASSASRIEGLLGLTARQLVCPKSNEGVCPGTDCMILFLSYVSLSSHVLCPSS
jgi:hypothetical protein